MRGGKIMTASKTKLLVLSVILAFALIMTPTLIERSFAQVPFKLFDKISPGGFGDIQNDYAWAMVQFNNDIYVGTGRNVLYFIGLGMKTYGMIPWNTQIGAISHPAGSPPPPFIQPGTALPSQADVVSWSNDMRGEIWRYRNNVWSKVRKAPTFVNPNNGYTYPEGIGYRAMATFNGAIYAGIGQGFGPTLLIMSTDGTNWVPVNTTSISATDTRAMIVHNGKFYIGVDNGLYVSTNPGATDNWKKVSNLQVASLKSFNGFLYIGTGNASGVTFGGTGFDVWRSSIIDPAGPADWTLVIPQGGGDQLNTVAGTMESFKGNLFVGSMGLPFATSSNNSKPFDVFRASKQDHWDLIVGNSTPSVPTVPRGQALSGYPSGFGNPMNYYCWSMAVHSDGYLYMGTFDSSSLERYSNPNTNASYITITKEQLLKAGQELIASGNDDPYLLMLMTLLKNADSTTLAKLIPQIASYLGGGDLWRTTDGINWTYVNLNGFDDANNYGIRTLLTTTKGLFAGTANPFKGCQIWRKSVPW
jgi:hypothetical protein